MVGKKIVFVCYIDRATKAHSWHMGTINITQWSCLVLYPSLLLDHKKLFVPRAKRGAGQPIQTLDLARHLVMFSDVCYLHFGEEYFQLIDRLSVEKGERTFFDQVSQTIL